MGIDSSYFHYCYDRFFFSLKRILSKICVSQNAGGTTEQIIPKDINKDPQFERETIKIWMNALYLRKGRLSPSFSLHNKGGKKLLTRIYLLWSLPDSCCAAGQYIFMEVMAFSRLCVPVLQLPMLDGGLLDTSPYFCQRFAASASEKIFSKAVTFLHPSLENIVKKVPDLQRPVNTRQTKQTNALMCIKIWGYGDVIKSSKGNISNDGL